MAKIYGPKITVSRGPVHDDLGMDLDYSELVNVKISMIKYLEKIFASFPEIIKSIRDTPAANHLFQVRDDDLKLLPEEQAQAFHHTVAQLLFLCMRARPDIQTAVSFLTKHV